MTTNHHGSLIDDSLPAEAVEELREAKATLETQGIADRLTELVGAPITASIKLLPGVAESALYRVIDKSLEVALEVALKTLRDDPGGAGTPKLLRHKVLAGLSGAAGGAFGGASVAAELPVSTVLILRSVADIARSQGEDLRELESRLACLEVFAFDPGRSAESSDGGDGGETPGEIHDDTEIGYFAVRAAMAKQISAASKYVVKNGVVDATAPPLIRLIGEIGKRFGVVVSQKLTAQAVPVIGAFGGALINSYFIDHYQDLARAHFTIRRLEREFGQAAVRQAYDSLDV
ncbi:EcsC family protein [Roseiconus nitratireducens]|uniref:EcsC family protein n=1 Tax=Roseiconus nitratireducens TaxID=2605748 RepID=A0A5M6D4Y3_9BACT|nr:EcsC family protein [Roseiconus nitratireducens]KAA5542578.1 EcsC family protein [Roseiconus nitratireducens]